MSNFEEAEQRARKMLENWATRLGYTLDTLPDLSTPEGYARACQSYAKATHEKLRLIDQMIANSKPHAHEHIYRLVKS